MSKQAKTYHIVEIDVLDRETILRSGLSRSEAREKLARLREAFGKDGVRYVMYHDRVTFPSQHPSLSCCPHCGSPIGHNKGCPAKSCDPTYNDLRYQI